MNVTLKLLDKKLEKSKEFEGQTLSTPIHSALTGECPRMDRDVSSETRSHQRVPVLFMFDILAVSQCEGCSLARMLSLRVSSYRDEARVLA